MKLNISQIWWIPFYTTILQSQGSPHLAMWYMGCSVTLDPLLLNAGIFGMARWGCKNTYIGMTKIKHIINFFNLFLEWNLTFHKYNAFLLYIPILPPQRFPHVAMGCSVTLGPLCLDCFPNETWHFTNIIYSFLTFLSCHHKDSNN